MPKKPSIAKRLTYSALDATAQILSRFDGWENQYTGFGTDRDKTTFGRFGAFQRLSDPELANLFHGDDMAARMVNVVPQEMFRVPFTVDLGNPADDTVLAEKLESLNFVAKLADAVRWDRLFGGSAIIIGADDGNPSEEELVPEKADDIDYLYVVDRRRLWPVSWYDEPGHPKLGQAMTYMVIPTVMGGAGGFTRIIHESRLVIFKGIPTGDLERLQWGGWGLSILQRAHDILRSFNTSWKAIEIMLTDGNQAVFKMSGLTELLGAKDGESLLRARMTVMEMYRSVMRALVVDAASGESFERSSMSFSDIPATLDKIMLRLSATAEIPVTILMGQSPAGMSATGDSDFRWFYNRMESLLTTDIAPQVRRFVGIWLRTKNCPIKRKIEKVTFVSPKLWSETPTEEATRWNIIAQTDATRITSSVYTPEEVALHRGQPGGGDGPIHLSKEAISAREAMLKSDLGRLAEGKPIATIDPVDTPTDPVDPLESPDTLAKESAGLAPLPQPTGDDAAAE